MLTPENKDRPTSEKSSVEEKSSIQAQQNEEHPYMPMNHQELVAHVQATFPGFDNQQVQEHVEKLIHGGLVMKEKSN